MKKILINYRPGHWSRMIRPLSDEERDWLVANSTPKMTIGVDGDIHVYAVFNKAKESLASEYVLRFGIFQIPTSWGKYK